MKQLGDITKVSHAEPVDVITGGSPCFPAGTMVLTDRGYRPIEEIGIGELVLTHMGRWRSVTAKGSHLAPTIVLNGNHYGLELTPDHNVFSEGVSHDRSGRRAISGGCEKVHAEDMVGRYWETPNKAEPLPFPNPMAAKAGENKFPAVTPAMFYFIGRWLGDGYVRHTPRTDGGRRNSTWGQVVICDSADKEEELTKAFAGAGFIHYHSQRPRQGGTVKVVTTHKAFCRWLVDNFGEMSYGKRIPGWVYGLEEDCRAQMLRGLLDSDGSKIRNHLAAYRAVTVSKALALGMRTLAETLGYTTTVFKTTPPPKGHILGREVNQRPWYEMRFTKSPSRPQLKGEYGTLYKVRGKREGQEIAAVYNITVDEDHTYVADGVVVFNCQDLSIAGKRAGLGGERSGLFHEMVRVIKEIKDDTRDAVHGRKPRFVVWENVAGAFSSNGGEDFRVVLESFLGLAGEDVRLPRPKKWAKCGAVYGRGGSLAWRTFDAQFWGVPQRRSRIALVVDIGGDRAGEVLFKPESERRHIAPCECAWQGPSAAPGGGAEGIESVGGIGCDVYNGDVTGETAQSVTTATGSSNGSGPKTLVSFTKASDACKCLTPWDSQTKRIHSPGGIAPSLISGAETSGTCIPSVAIPIEGNGARPSHQGAGYGGEGDPSFTLNAVEKHAVAFAQNQRNEVRDLGGEAGAPAREPGMKQQACVAVEPTTVYAVRTAQTGANGIGVSATAAHTLDGTGGEAVAVFRKTAHPRNADEGQGWEDTDKSDALNVFDNGEKRTPTLVVDAVDAVNAVNAVNAVGYDNHPQDSRITEARDGKFAALPAQMGTGGGNTPLVVGAVETVGCLSAGGHPGGLDSQAAMAGQLAVTLLGEDKTGCLTARDYKGVGRWDTFSRVVAIGDKMGERVPQTLACETETYAKQSNSEFKKSDVSAAMKASNFLCGGGGDSGLVRGRMAVRRLTPTECERLQGIPDRWTDVPGASDSSRYKQMGNGWASPQWYYVLGNIADLLPEDATIGSLFDGVGTAPMIWSDLHGGDKSLCTWGSEIDKHAQMVTAYHFPETEAV